MPTMGASVLRARPKVEDIPDNVVVSLLKDFLRVSLEVVEGCCVLDCRPWTRRSQTITPIKTIQDAHNIELST